MSKVKITEIKHDVFGNCVKLENGLVELCATLDFGPRILHFSLSGKENMMYNDLEKKPIDKPFEIYGGESQIMYGGHRVWLSPEIVPRCYHPDNLPVSCERQDNGVILKSPVEEHTRIRKIMDIYMADDLPEVKIDHTIVNEGLWEIELGVWCVTMLAAGGRAVIPMPDAKTGFLPNRIISLWDYTEMNDKRIYWGRDFITVTQDIKIINPAKIGLNNEAGWAAYFNKGQVFIKSFEPEINGVFPDNGCCYESYVNGLMLESETLSGIELLAPGDSISHCEEWEIHESDFIPKNDENEIRREMEKYLYNQ